MFDPTPITLDAVVSTAQTMLDDGWRLVAQTAVDRGDDGMDLLYHFDRNLTMKDFRLNVPKGTIIPSISPVYFTALLVENENRDLFGIEYSGLVLDFNRTLYLEEAGDPLTAPFCKISTFSKVKCEV